MTKAGPIGTVPTGVIGRTGVGRMPFDNPSSSLITEKKLKEICLDPEGVLLRPREYPV